MRRNQRRKGVVGAGQLGFALALWGAATGLAAQGRRAPFSHDCSRSHQPHTVVASSFSCLRPPPRLAFAAAPGTSPAARVRGSAHSFLYCDDRRICSQQPDSSGVRVCARPRLRPPVLKMSGGGGGEDTMPNLPQPVSPLWGDWTDIEVKAATVIWVNRMVIGLDLCPFALASMPGLRVVVSDAVTKEEALDFLALEMGYLVQQPKNKPATTLVVFPLALFGPEEDPMSRSYPRGPVGARPEELALNEGFLQGGSFVDPAAAADRYRTQAFPSSFRQGSGGISSLSEKGDYGLVAQGLEPLAMDDERDVEVEAAEQDADESRDVEEVADEDIPFWGLYGDVEGGGDTMIVPAPEGPDAKAAAETGEDSVPFWGLRGDADGGSDNEIVPGYPGKSGPERAASAGGVSAGMEGQDGSAGIVNVQEGGLGGAAEAFGASGGEALWVSDPADGGKCRMETRVGVGRGEAGR